MDEEAVVSDDGLSIVLVGLAEDLSEDAVAANALIDESTAQAASLDQLEERIGAIARDVGVERPVVPTSVARTLPDEIASPPVEWDAIVAASSIRLVERGVEPATVRLDDLLDPSEVERLEARFSGGFRLRADLDRADVVAAVTAGVVATLVDFLLVRIPKDTIYRKSGLRDEFMDRGSPLTKWMHSHSLPHDNPLSEWCKASFDRVNLKGTGGTLAGSGPRTHRYHTLGHDPLLGLVFGTIDIMRGSLTGIDRAGQVVRIPGLAAPQHNPLVALATEVLHLISDVATSMGLPVPGWTLTGLMQFGSIGADNETVAALARKMYLGGYDTRHFLTMATSPCAGEVVLRAYWGLRKTFDEQFADEVAHTATVAGSEHLSSHPRFAAMALTTHSIACAANAGKVAAYQNPLAFNYAQWLAFLHALTRWTITSMSSPSRVLGGHARANLQELAEGWPVIDYSEAPALGGT